MIRYDNIHKVFGDLEVLKGISFEIGTGEVVCILGPSGSGKTTLLRCTNFLEIPTRGKVTIADLTVDAEHFTKEQVNQLRRHSTMVFQNYNLFRNMTALENVMECLVTVQKKPKAEAREIAEHFLNQVGMGQRMDYYPSQLSGGQQQRVSIARALAGKPSVILADEPTGALDSRTGREVLGFLKKLNREGDTVVLITHDNSIAVKADRIIRLQDGKIIYDGDARDPRAVVQPGEAGEADETQEQEVGA